MACGRCRGSFLQALRLAIAFPSERKRRTMEWISGVAVTLLITILLAFGMYGCPRYNVYQQRMEGQAILAHAQSSREVAVAEAKAKMESASLLADAEIARAKGVAAA